MSEGSPAPNPMIVGGMHWWCSTHLEPFRERWPEGFAIAQLRLFQIGASDPRVHSETGKDANRIQPVLNSHAPLCCWLPANKVLPMIEMALRGEMWRDPEWPEEMR